MAKARTFRPRSNQAGLGLLITGLGLVLFAVAAGIFLLSNPAEPASSSSGNTSGYGSAIPASVDFPAPEIALNTLDGEAQSLADYRGEVVLVNNWATWCPPCKAEMPELQAFYENHKDSGFKLIAIDSGDAASDVRSFVEANGLTFTIWLDPTGVAISAFRNNALPSSYVIDREGTVRLAWSGAIDLATLEEHVAPLINQ